MFGLRSLSRLFAASLVGITLTLPSLTSAAEKSYNLKFQSSDNAGNPNFVIQQEWAKRVKEMTNGASSPGDIFRAVLPFIAMQVIAVALLVAFPQLAIWWK